MDAVSAFESIDGIEYTKKQEEIDIDFAHAKCDFCRDTSLDCIEKVLKEIKCLRKDKTDMSCYAKDLYILNPSYVAYDPS